MADAPITALETALEPLALTVVVIDPSDLAAAGDLLEKVEALIPPAEELADGAMLEVIGVLKRGVELMIMDDLDNADDFTSAASEAVSVLQEMCRQRSQTDQPSVRPDEFLARFYPLAGQEPPGDEAAAGEDEAAADQADQSAEDEGSVNVLPGDLDVELATSFVGEALELLQEIEVAILTVEGDPSDLEAINAIFRPFHTIKGVSGFLNLNVINHLAHEGENLLDEAREGRLILEGPVVDLILEAVDLLRVLIGDVSTQITTGQPTNAAFAVEAMVARIVQAKDSGGRDVPGGAAAPAKPAAPVGVPAAGTDKTAPPGREAKAAPAQTAVKVDTVKLDNMVDMVGELVIALSLVTQNEEVAAIRDQKLERDLGQLGRITSELQKTAMSLRMVPINQTFQRMVRLVRDLSRKSGKQVDFQMDGQDTEIDRTMVDAIYDPLVHMVRNSMDHGLEQEDERLDKGKSAKGRLLLRAYHQGGRICIEIEDDGRGLDAEKLFKKAVDKGLVSPDAQLSEAEIHNLIMAPGFSTAETITDISGRGVGMDVVRAAVENLRGNMEIESQLGVFTRFTIRFPLTMAIIEGMVVGLAGERYIIPALCIEEVLKPREEDHSTVTGGSGEMVMVRGHLVPPGQAGPSVRP